MKISVVTPVYNAVNTLEKTILSAINQNITAELEYIIIDGGSTDGSLELMHRYADRITKIISEPDGGIYDAMNKGINLATGDIIGIINADDWYKDGALAAVERTFTADPEIAIAYSPVDSYFSGQYRNTFIPGKLENLVHKFILNHPSCFVRSSVYREIGLFDLAYAMAADYDFILRAYSHGVKFSQIETPLAAYSMDGTSSKPLNSLKSIQESWEISSKLISHSSRKLRIKNFWLYTNWVAKDIIMLVAKSLIKPEIRGKIKNWIRGKFGKFPTDEYGAW